jgi:hypothetical protein
MAFEFSFSRPGKSLNFSLGYGKSWNLLIKEEEKEVFSVLCMLNCSLVSCVLIGSPIS